MSVMSAAKIPASVSTHRITKSARPATEKEDGLRESQEPSYQNIDTGSYSGDDPRTTSRRAAERPL